MMRFIRLELGSIFWFNRKGLQGLGNQILKIKLRVLAMMTIFFLEN
jgi:hypothetical protein